MPNSAILSSHWDDKCLIQCGQIPYSQFNLHGTSCHRLLSSMLHKHHSSKYIEYAFRSCLLVYREEITWIYCRNLYHTCIYNISFLIRWEYRDYTVVSDKSTVSMNGYISMKILSVWCLEWSSIFCCYRNIIVCYASNITGFQLGLAVTTAANMVYPLEFVCILQSS